MATDFVELTESWANDPALSDRVKPEGYDQRLMETQDFIASLRGMAPHVARYKLTEALTTSDFPLMFGDVLDRQMIAGYKAVDPVWKLFSKARPTVNDFRTAYDFATYGGDQLLAEVGEKGEYLASARSELRYTIAVTKRGRQFDISWETLINDDLGALRDTPERFARAAVRTEHRLLTTEYANDVGAHVEGAGGNLYAIGTNAVVGLLTIANLETGLETVHEFQDLVNEPIMNRSKFLVVPPALEMTARQILTSTNKSWHYGGDDENFAAAGPMPTANVVSGMGLTLVIDPYLPVVDTTNGDTAWYLFADPNDIAALGYAHLAGHESPEIVMKASDKVSVTGAPVGPFAGDFATDNVFYRVRHVFGVTSLDWRATYAGGIVS